MPSRKFVERDPADRILPDKAEWDVILAELASSHLRAAVLRGARIAAAQYDVALSFDVVNPLVIEFLQNYTALMANRVNETIRERLRAVLIEAIESGQHGRALRDAVMEAMSGEANAARAEMIARTEVARAEYAGGQEQARESGARRKIWKANQDACEFCRAIDGMVTDIEEPFFRVGDQIALEQDDSTEEEPTAHVMRLDYSDTPHPPLHPRCRCFEVFEWDN